MEKYRELCAGALMVLIGAAAAIKGSAYAVGSLSAMGPGFFPVSVGVLLALSGVAIAAPALRLPTTEALRVQTQWRGWLAIVLGVVVFIVVAKYGGLLPATLGLVFISALGDRSNTLKSALLVALCVGALCVVVFSVALRVQLPLFGWGQ